MFQNIVSPANPLSMIVFICWSIWKLRNHLIFRGHNPTSMEVAASAIRYYDAFFEANAPPCPPLSLLFYILTLWRALPRFP